MIKRARGLKIKTKRYRKLLKNSLKKINKKITLLLTDSFGCRTFWIQVDGSITLQNTYELAKCFELFSYWRKNIKIKGCT